MGATHPQHSAVSAPCRGRSGRGCGPVWTSPGLTPLPTDAVGRSGPRPQMEPGCPCPCPPWGPAHSPATMSVKSKPFFTDLRCTWLGSVAKPTYCLSMSWTGVGQVRGTLGFPGQPRALPLQSSGQGGSRAGSPGEGASQWQQRARACGQRPPEVEGGWAWRVVVPPRASQRPSLCPSGATGTSSEASVLGWGAEGTRTWTPQTCPRSSKAGEAPASILTPPRKWGVGGPIWP